MSEQQFISTANSKQGISFSPAQVRQQQAASCDLIKKLLSLDPPWKHFPDVVGEAKRDLEKQTDARLVELFLKGNSRAFDVLMKRHESKVKQILRVNLYDKSYIDDVSQEVWELVLLLLQSGKYEEDGHFYKWLCTVVYTKAMKTNRKKKSMPAATEYNPVFHDKPDESSSFYYESEWLDEVKKIISGFSERERSLIMMHVQEGLSFVEIARKWNLKSGSVRQTHRRLMERTLKELQTKNSVPDGTVTL